MRQKIEVIKIRVMKKLLLVVILFSWMCGMRAQSVLKIKNDIPYTDVTISSGTKAMKVKSVVSTGTPICVLDSAFAVDSCGISYVDYRKTENHHSPIPLYFVDPNAKIDGVKFCGRSYAHLNVRIENLAKKQWADGAKFVIGSNLLGKEKVWNFNLKTSTIDANGAMADKVMWKIKCTKNSDLMGSCVLAVSFCAKGKLLYPVFDTAADMSCKSQCSGKESGSADKTLLIFDDFQTYVSSPISESVIGMQMFSGHSFSIDYEHNLINVYQ